MVAQHVTGQTQGVDAPLTGSAVFVALTINDRAEAYAAVRDALSSAADIAKNVASRDLTTMLTCTVGIGARVWTRLTGLALPAQLHPFSPVVGGTHTAPATPGDILLHIRADRRDMCFEYERQLLDALGDAVTVVDETVGFRYFDLRDLLGFVDGTANPVGQDLPAATLVGDEDPDFAGGSYVVVQKYLHPLESWRSLSTEQQEAIIGRTKAENIELDDAESGQKSHKTLSTIVDEHGEHDILRDNMPFGSPGSAEFGTYFIAYSKDLWVIERMLERMFIGDPPGLHDRLLDFSTAVTGSTFFAPSAPMLEGIGAVTDAGANPEAESQGGDARVSGTAPSADQPGPAPSGIHDYSLGLGSLRNAPEGVQP